jgi:hypothetical protein
VLLPIGHWQIGRICQTALATTAFDLNKLKEGDEVKRKWDSSRGSFPIAVVKPNLIPTLVLP